MHFPSQRVFSSDAPSLQPKHFSREIRSPHVCRGQRQLSPKKQLRRRFLPHSSSSFLHVQGTLSKKNIVEPLKLDVFFIILIIFDSPSYSSFRLLRRFPPVRLQQQNWGGKEGPPMLIGNKNLLTSNLRQKTGALFEVAANRGADDRPTEKETTTVIEGLEDPINPD